MIHNTQKQKLYKVRNALCNIAWNLVQNTDVF